MPRAFPDLPPGAPAFAGRGGVLHRAKALAEAAVPGLRFALPLADLLEAFARQAQPALDSQQVHHSERQTLSALRDSLLPRLLTAGSPGSAR